jgi:hypothetical protein
VAEAQGVEVSVYEIHDAIDIGVVSERLARLVEQFDTGSKCLGQS